MTVLVTGGSGFIGTWVLHELLSRGATPVVVDVQPGGDRWRRVLGGRAGEIVWADAPLTDCDRLHAVIDRHGVTHVIHLAALLTPACQQDPWLGLQVNVVGSVAVFEAARRSGRVQAISYASSYAVYGPEPGEANRTTTFYGAFKQSVDLIADQYWRHYGLASVAVRPHVVYGPEREFGLSAGPSLAARAAARSESYRIGYTGPASYDYVEDVARAFVRGAFECPPGATVVDLVGEPATTDDFINVIREFVPTADVTAAGPTLPPAVPPKLNPIGTLFPDWRTTSLRDGVRKTIEYYRPKGA